MVKRPPAPKGAGSLWVAIFLSVMLHAGLLVALGTESVALIPSASSSSGWAKRMRVEFRVSANVPSSDSGHGAGSVYASIDSAGAKGAPNQGQAPDDDMQINSSSGPELRNDGEVSRDSTDLQRGNDAYAPSTSLSSPPTPLGEIVVPWPAGYSWLGRTTAVFTLFIDETGMVREMVPDGHTLLPALEHAAIDTFSKARFSPGVKDGRAVKSILRIEIIFEAQLQPTSPEMPAAVWQRKEL